MASIPHRPAEIQMDQQIYRRKQVRREQTSVASAVAAAAAAAASAAAAIVVKALAVLHYRSLLFALRGCRHRPAGATTV